MFVLSCPQKPMKDLLDESRIEFYQFRKSSQDVVFRKTTEDGYKKADVGDAFCVQASNTTDQFRRWRICG